MTAISATFSDFRIVKGRKVAQFVFETPLEAADDALSKLGGLPRPDAERWVGIAPLVGKPKAEQRPEAPAPEPEKAKKRKPFHTLPRSQQAAIRINDEEFRRWWSGGAADHGRACVDDAVKVECVVSSKAHLNDNPTAAAKWDTIERDYQAWRSLNRPVETEERA